MCKRDIYLITKSPSEHYSISKIKTKETRQKFKTLNECENAIKVLDDTLGSSNSKDTD